MTTWKDNVRKVVPYTPGEQPQKTKMIKLNTNENPYPPSPMVEEARKEIEGLRLYPDSNAMELVSALAKYHGIKENQIFIGVGSDDVLGMAFLTFFNSDKPILFPDITYSFYDVWAKLYRIPYECQPLTDDFSIRKGDYYKENGGIIFPNPNAPTGKFEPVSMIEDIIIHNQESLVIIDEAYVDFGGESVLPLINKYSNLLVVRTFSKSRALAGLRIGYAMGNEELIKALSDVKQSYNSYTMNQAALQLGVASVKDETYFRKNLKLVVDTREWFKKELIKLGFEFPDSKTNFVFAKHKTMEARYIFEEAMKHDIYVRFFDKPRINEYLRITIGTKEQMEQVVEFLTTLGC